MRNIAWEINGNFVWKSSQENGLNLKEGFYIGERRAQKKKGFANEEFLFGIIIFQKSKKSYQKFSFQAGEWLHHRIGQDMKTSLGKTIEGKGTTSKWAVLFVCDCENLGGF